MRPLFTANSCHHTTPAGADLTASLIVAGLKGIRSPLVELLSAKGQAVAAAQSMEGYAMKILGQVVSAAVVLAGMFLLAQTPALREQNEVLSSGSCSAFMDCRTPR